MKRIPFALVMGLVLIIAVFAGCSQENREPVTLAGEFQGPVAAMGIDAAALTLLYESEEEVVLGAAVDRDIHDYLEKLESAGYYETAYSDTETSESYVLDNGELQVCLTSITDVASFKDFSGIRNIDQLRSENLVLEMVLLKVDDEFPLEGSHDEEPDDEFPEVEEPSQAADPGSPSVMPSDPPSSGSAGPSQPLTPSAEPSYGDDPIAEEYFIDENTQVDDYAVVDSGDERIQVPPGSGNAVSSEPSNDPGSGLVKDAETYAGTAR